MAQFKSILILLGICFTITEANNFIERIEFLKDFMLYEERPSTIVSHLEITKKKHVQLCRAFSSIKMQFKASTAPSVNNRDDIVYLADCKSHYTWELLYKAIKDKSIESPARWLLLLDDDHGNAHFVANSDNYKSDIEHRLHNIYIHMNTEVYVAVQRQNYVLLFTVYKIKPYLPLIWEEFGVWSRSGGFGERRPPPVAMRRRNLGRTDVVAAAVILDNGTLEHMPDYLHREVDTLTKLMYYMTTHLVEWVNGSMVINRTTSWGYRQPDGRYDGVVREMQDGRADLSGTVMIPTKERSKYMNFVLAPAPVEAMFIFRKPALASVTNIYVLPFSIGVWVFIVILIFVSSLTLFLAYFREEVINPRYSMTWPQKVSEGFFETLCLVFQQGTAYDPDSIAGKTRRFHPNYSEVWRLPISPSHKPTWRQPQNNN